jgi:hypothetical protein
VEAEEAARRRVGDAAAERALRLTCWLLRVALLDLRWGAMWRPRRPLVGRAAKELSSLAGCAAGLSRSVGGFGLLPCGV